jgi:signal transduction histidine kinase
MAIMVNQGTMWLGHLLTEINRKVSTGAPYQTVLDFALESLNFLIPYDRVGIALLEGEENNRRLRLMFLKSKIPLEQLSYNYAAPVRGSSLAGVLESREPRIINDLIEYALVHPTSESTKRALQDGIRSSLTCPLIAGGRSIGTLFFSSSQPNTYKDAHVDTFLSIAEEISLIVDYGRIRESSESLLLQTRNFNSILHDLRSPLSLIEGFVRTSLEEHWFQNLDHDAKEVFEVLLRNTQSMFELLNELLEVSRLEAKSENVVTEHVLLGDFFGEMANFGRILAERKEIRFHSHLAADIPNDIKINKQNLRRIIQNLFSNAVKFSNRHSIIEFDVCKRDDRLEFSVRDRGLGINSTEIPNLFKDFGKTSTRPTEGEPSTGLGLSIIKRLVELHHGGISVASEVGVGSTFSFWIPLEIWHEQNVGLQIRDDQRWEQDENSIL